MPSIGGPDTGLLHARVGTPVRLIYNPLTGAYPPRPGGLPGGLGWWIGPIQPPEMLDNDSWDDVS